MAMLKISGLLSGMKVFYVLLLSIVLWSQLSFSRECNTEYELPCLNKESCIHKMQWCDNFVHCSDHSDEYFCNGASCPENYFRCKNGKCVPGEARCDGFDDCRDGSDERCPRPADYNVDSFLKSDVDDISSYKVTSLNTTDAITKAAEYLLRKRRFNNGWNNFTHRAVVALTFAEKAGRIPETSFLKKELDIKLLLNLMQLKVNPSMCDLAHYINAMYATCQDPRNFQGIDLVRRLKTEVNKAKKMELPYVYLTLCIAGSTDREDTLKLLHMYDRMGIDRIDSKALIIMALKCISKRDPVYLQRIIYERVQKFMQDVQSIISTTDIYTKALCYQALNALDYKIEKDLLTHQQPDGSFGDLLATYYAIPALLNKSLLDLKCEPSNRRVMSAAIQLPGFQSDVKKVTYSLWIDKDTFRAHSMIITLNGNKTFYDVMKMAEDRSSIFNFMYDPSRDGAKIYSLAGIPNDAETGRAWTLYRGKENVSINLKRSLAKQELGVDRIFPKSGEHFVFWFERCVGRAWCKPTE